MKGEVNLNHLIQLALNRREDFKQALAEYGLERFRELYPEHSDTPVFGRVVVDPERGVFFQVYQEA